MKTNVDEQVKEFAKEFQTHGMHCGVQIAGLAKVIHTEAIAVIPLYRSCIVIEQTSEDKEVGCCTMHAYADPHWLGNEIDIETLKSGEFHSMYHVQGDRQGPIIVQTKKTEHNELAGAYDELHTSVVDKIKNGSYKGTFYGIEGSWARKHYQPLLDYFLYRETKKIIK